MDNTWEITFTELFDRCLAAYRSGNRDFTRYYTPEDSVFLAAIGCKPREFFDFIEDLADMGGPSREAALLIAAARRDYFLVEQEGELSSAELTNAQLPARDAELGGFPWLPRMLAKARAKLKGELHPDVMYCCGGDRNFLSKNDMHPADFLRAVWAAEKAGDPDQAVAEYVQNAKS